MRTRQFIIVEENRLRLNEVREVVALFGPDGNPLLLSGGSEDSDDIQKQVSSLKGRITKLENRLKR